MSKLFETFGIKVKKGDYIFKEGDRADFLYMIHKGKVQISKKTRGGDEQISILEESQFFGEMAIINRQLRSANAFALEDSELIKMDEKSFLDNLKTNHHFAVNVSRLLSERLRESIDDYAKLAEIEQDLLLKSEILEECLKNGKKDKEGKWMLIELDSFEKKVELRFGWSHRSFHNILNDLVMQQKVSVKKNKNGTSFIAYRLN